MHPTKSRPACLEKFMWHYYCSVFTTFRCHCHSAVFCWVQSSWASVDDEAAVVSPIAGCVPRQRLVDAYERLQVNTHPHKEWFLHLHFEFVQRRVRRHSELLGCVLRMSDAVASAWRLTISCQFPRLRFNVIGHAVRLALERTLRILNRFHTTHKRYSQCVRSSSATHKMGDKQTGQQLTGRK